MLNTMSPDSIAVQSLNDPPPPVPPPIMLTDFSSNLQSDATLEKPTVQQLQPHAPIQPYKAFFILGIGLLLVAILTVPFASPYIWVLAGVAAMVQISIGSLLRKKTR
jgi:hypothetical protein